jgi:N-sulfoglucosamine sulfohydrolase
MHFVRTATILCCCLVWQLALSPLSLKAEAKKPPNILFVIADDWGCHASAYGTPWVKTPAFDRLAREGLLFQHCYTPNAKCAPSRACLLTGRNSWQLKEAANHICYFPPEYKSWCEVLAEHGWTMGYTTKGWGPGVAKTAAGGKRSLTGIPLNQHSLKPPATGISNHDYAANFHEFIRTAPVDKPWCFWVGSLEPHREFEFGSGVSKGGKKLTDIDHVPACWPDTETVRHDMLDYAYEIEHDDQILARLLTTLEERKMVDDTLVIVTSDHGMPFPRGKGNTYEMSNHVPLAIRWPRGIAGKPRRVEEFVSFIDLAPTILDVAGIAQADSGMASITGKALTDIFRGEQASEKSRRDHVLVGRERNDIGRPHDQGYPTRGIRRGDWLYLHNFEPSRWPAVNPETGYLDCDASPTKTLILQRHRENAADPYWALCFGKRPQEELYHVRNDPDQVKNLASDANHAATLQSLKEQLWQELTQQEDPRVLGNGEVFDRYPFADPTRTNFYDRFLNGENVRANWISPTDIEPQKLD